ncbi:hypothetical protein Tco_0652282 [Tanacetum coccineum]|uniref:Uncharacterized protein n=1 Tax=Tanacetum coccineum TaxID=301880 RepID=A0ABQ4WXE2_9ASTR
MGAVTPPKSDGSGTIGLAGHQRSKNTAISYNKANTFHDCDGFGAQSVGSTQLKDLRVDHKFLRTVITKVPLLFAVVENFEALILVIDKMTDQNVPAQAPTRTDEQIQPRSAWLQIGKRNILFDLQKIQKNPIFQISVDILRNTNFFRAFSASASVLAIYIQQFWNTMKYDKKTEVYSCQVDEQWFNLSADLLRNALEITPVYPAHLFELPPTVKRLLIL